MLPSLPMLSDKDRETLNALQQRYEFDDALIEEIYAAEVDRFEQDQQRYCKEYSTAIRHQYFLSEETRIRLRCLQQDLSLGAGVVQRLEETETQAYHQDKQAYERLYADAIHQAYPLSAETQTHLKQQQTDLHLFDRSELQALEANLVELLERKKEQYRDRFLQVLYQEYPLHPDTRLRLQSQQQRPWLSDEVLSKIEQSARQQFDRDRQACQQTIATAIHQRMGELPIQEAQAMREQFGLSESVVSAIVQEEMAAYAAEQQRHQSGQENYRREFSQIIHRYDVLAENWQLSRIDRARLDRQKRESGLSEAEVEAIEQPAIAARREELSQRQVLMQPQSVQPRSELVPETVPETVVVEAIAPPEPVAIPSPRPVSSTSLGPTPRLPSATPQLADPAPEFIRSSGWRSPLKVVIALATLAGIMGVGTLVNNQRKAELAAKASLDQISTLKSQKDYRNCVNQARSFPENSALQSQVQELLKQCSEQIQARSLLDEAIGQEKSRSLAKALATAAKIPENTDNYADAQRLIKRIESKWPVLAKEYYQKGNLEAAKQFLQKVLPNSKEYQQAQKDLKEWPEEWKNNTAALNTAETQSKTAQTIEDWKNVVSKANEVKHPHLLARANELKKRAKETIGWLVAASNATLRASNQSEGSSGDSSYGSSGSGYSDSSYGGGGYGYSSGSSSGSTSYGASSSSSSSSSSTGTSTATETTFQPK